MQSKASPSHGPLHPPFSFLAPPSFQDLGRCVGLTIPRTASGTSSIPLSAQKDGARCHLVTRRMLQIRVYICMHPGRPIC